MKVTVELDCTPEEARRLMGLPDVQKLNEAYLKQMAKFVQGATNMEQMQNFTKMVAPMGEAGLKMFSTFLTGALGGGLGAKSGKAADKSGEDEDDKTAG